MSGINQLMLNQLGHQPGSSDAAIGKMSVRGKSEMQFHSFLSAKVNQQQVSQAADPKPIERTPTVEPKATDNRNTGPVADKSNANSTQQQPSPENEKVVTEVKKAVQENPEEVDAEVVVARVLSNKDINMEEVNIEQLLTEIKEALAELGEGAEELAGVIAGHFAELQNKGSQFVDDMEGLADDLLADDLLMGAKDKLLSKGESILNKIERNLNKSLADSSNQDGKSALDKFSSAQDKLLNMMGQNGDGDADKDGFGLDLKDKLNLGKQDLSLMKGQSPQSALGGISNLMQMSQVQGKVAQSQQMSIPGKLGSADFKQGFSEKVMFMMKGEINSAAIKLNPPELGPLEIKLNINNTSKQADLMIITQHGLVKDSVEQAMPRLRDMLSESGIQLNNVNVSDQNTKQNQESAQQNAEQEQGGTSSFYQDVFGDGDLSDEDIMSQMMMHKHRPDGLVDFYA